MNKSIVVVIVVLGIAAPPGEDFGWVQQRTARARALAVRRPPPPAVP
jgi:hypothetical protein